MKLKAIFNSLRQKEFAKLYTAQTISLLGDAFTWVGVALLAYEFAGQNAASVLSVALTLRVIAFIIFAPYAGVLADKINRRKILLISDFSRMLIVLLLAFVQEQWQLYALIFLLNISSAFFTPAFKASVPQMIKDKDRFAPAITLSNATYQVLGIMGPAVAGAAAGWLGSRDIFLADSISYLLSALMVLTISRYLFNMAEKAPEVVVTKWQEIAKGTQILFSDKIIRFALLIELVAAIVGANVLVNTVGYVKGTLGRSDQAYGWVMSAVAIGAAAGALLSALIDKTPARRRSLLVGVTVVCLAVLPANHVPLYWLIPLWALAGLGQNMAEIPSQMLIAERVPLEQQGRVYGAHFAWSHLWWAIGYPIAGVLGAHFTNTSFLIAGLLGAGVLLFLLFTNLISTYTK
jgi:MFS transporter, NRE family, putaive nickel resistance protein